MASIAEAVSKIGHLSVNVASGDVLDVRQFTVHERLSSLFRVTLVVVSDNPNVDFEAAVGRPARFSIAGTMATPRFWSGICAELHQIAVEEGGLSTYHLDIVPSLWLATQRRNYRMFQHISELDIGLTLLSEWGIEPVKRISGTHKKRKYRVQYGESDFAFLCRMFEDAGITFFFEQTDGETKLVLADAPQTAEAHPPIHYRDDVTTAHGAYVTRTRIGRRVRPGKYTIRDHDYRKDPKYKLAASASSGGSVEDKLERYHYTPGAFLFGADRGDATPHADDRGKARTDEAEGAVLAQKRLDAKRGSASTCSFETNVAALAPGVVMSLLGHSRSDLGEGKKWLIVESVMSGARDGDWTHHCEAQSATIPYRPPLITPKPKTQGVESATVVGPAGEEIHCDEFGRVRVHFHWDRESQMDDKSSCWIHVNQPWGGAGYGGSALPRIGQEVLVDFLGGDPDRPVIIGRVYTNLQKTPYKLPDNKTQTGIKSNSTGNTGGYNEIMFEDSAGKELLRVQAERDMQSLIKHDKRETVGNDRTRLVGRNENITIGQDLTKMVNRNEREVTGVNRSVTVGVNRSTQIGSIDSTIVGDTHTVIVSPPGEGWGGDTSITITHNKIVLDTGAGAEISMTPARIELSTGAGASITLEGPIIKLEAVEIVLESSVLLKASSHTTSLSSKVCTVDGESKVAIRSGGEMTIEAKDNLDISSSGGDVNIKGGPNVHINP